jgi:hypothetical protein
MTEELIAGSQVVAGLITALATIALVYVTAVLTRETRRLGDLGHQPQVVVNIEASPTSGMALNLVVVNTGTATAYDIRIESSPPFPTLGNGREIPLQRLSLLKPAQQLKSILAYYDELARQPFSIRVSWAKAPQSSLRTQHEYEIDVGALGGASIGRDELYEMNRNLEQIRRDFGHLASGFRRLGVNVFDARDRLREERDQNRHLRRIQREEQPPRGNESEEG